MKKKQRFENQLMRISLAASLPLFGLLLLTLYYANISVWLLILTALIGGMLVAYTAYSIHDKAEYQFRSLSNLLEAMTHGEYSMRAVSDHTGGAHDELVVTINGLAETLARQRWEASESQLLVNTIIEHIDVAIIALDEADQISFLNPAAQKLLQLEDGADTKELSKKLKQLQPLTSGQRQAIELSFGQQKGRFNIYVEEFRKSGLQHKLLFLSDVTILLRSEERKAWQSLVRVISHEINNSLSPIASISQTLKQLLSRGDDTPPATEDLKEGLSIIQERATGLSSFVDSYKQIAKLPEPQKQPTSIQTLVEKTCFLFDGQQLTIEAKSDIKVSADPIQIEQVLINLLKNAIEATEQAKSNAAIDINWQSLGDTLQLTITDGGCGIRNPDNLFVPFYSTKKNGSGIGLVFCRQVIEAHGGRLTLANRADTRGTCVTIELPI